MSESIQITGGIPLTGEVRVSGAKNAATKALVATLLASEPVTLTNMPQISDTEVTMDMLEALGATVTRNESTVIVDASTVNTAEVTEAFSRKNRIPILLFGPLLTRFGKARIPAPGGCKIGARPINFHLPALESMGVSIEQKDDYYHAKLTGKRLTGAVISLEFPSVGATENIMLSAVLADGMTVIKNAAIEPEIVDLAKMLQSMGAIISLDVNRTWVIEGVESLKGATHRIIPDRIEAASFIAAAALTKGNVFVRDARQEDMLSYLNAIRRLGIEFEIQEAGIRVLPRSGTLKPSVVETDVHPGFMTDWQQPFVMLLTQATGVSIMHETIYENRFGYAEALNTMGANITVHKNCLGGRACRFKDRNFSHSAVIVGSTPLKAANIEIPDLRAGFSYLLAALIAEGTSTITGVEHVKRGYESIVEKLQGLGAKMG